MLQMAQLPAKIKNTIDNYLKALNRNDIPIKEAILLGSYARGNYQEWSDIDIALVSDIIAHNRIAATSPYSPPQLLARSDIAVFPS